MGTAAQIRTYRVRAGKSAREVAEHLGLNPAWYHDLEEHDDELVSTLTLFQAIDLASLLGAGLGDLLQESTLPAQAIPLTELPLRIDAHLARVGISVEEFEEEVGWELREFLQDPIRVAAESPLIFLQTLSTRLGINWLSLVPAADVA